MKYPSLQSDVLIIGGGFAGLAAALRLQKRGVKIQILEKRPFFGGRAYSFRENKTGDVVDNGQHLLMGAYHHTFEFLKSLGTYSGLQFQNNLEVTFAQSAEDFFTLKCPGLPAPFHLAWGLLKFKGLSFSDKLKMLKLIQFSKRYEKNGFNADQTSVLELLKKTQQTPRAIQRFWEPVTLATINEPIDQASGEQLIQVIREAFLAQKQDSSMVIPQVGFSELYAKPAEAYLRQQSVPIYFQTQVTAIHQGKTGWEVQTSTGKTLKTNQILFAVPPNALAKILQLSDPVLQPLASSLAAFKSNAIVSINLWFQDFNPPQKFVGFLESPIHWIFNKAQIYPGGEKYLSLVVSGAEPLAQKNKAQLVELALKELQRFYPALSQAKLLHSQVIKEWEATFSGQKGLRDYRPQSQSSVPGIYLAGDWTRTQLPATIESAVKSGHQAAAAILDA